MATKIILQQSGMGIDEGTVVRWLKKVGEAVRQGEIVVEIETAKAIQGIEAPVNGTLARIAVTAGETARVNAEIGEIAEG